MTCITEIIPDLNELPDWAREAFEEGQFFTAIGKKIKEHEMLIDIKHAVSDYLLGLEIPEFAKANGGIAGLKVDLEVALWTYEDNFNTIKEDT